MQNIMSGYWDTAGVGKIGSASQTLLGADVCKLCTSTAKAELPWLCRIISRDVSAAQPVEVGAVSYRP
jgi:hypothetical protein